ncbi:MAG: DNA polymerase III subunit beta [Mycoplasmataceae bacterium]|jgi:DNA polymerase-3 subunit beta|nr:DNA polymerase III subunit beta [Mycoplasmataceae bacterium]
MKFTIKRQQFTNALKFNVNIIDNININPLLNSVLLKVGNNILTIISSNNTISIQNQVKESLEIVSDGKVLVKGRILFNILSKIKEEEITFEIIDNSIGRVSSSSFSSDINILDATSYPNINFSHEGWQKFSLPQELLGSVVSKLAPITVHTNEYNSPLAGVLFDAKRLAGCIEAVGTDSFHLAYLKREYTGEQFKMVLGSEVLKHLSELSSLGKNIVFYLNNFHLIIEVDNFLLSCRLIEGEYPSAIKAIEMEQQFQFQVSKSLFNNALDRGMILAAGDKKPTVLLHITPGKVKLTCRSIEYGSSYEELDINGYEGESINILLNVKYLSDLIKNIDSEKVVFAFTAANKPIILKEENNNNYTSLILPIRNI